MQCLSYTLTSLTFDPISRSSTWTHFCSMSLHVPLSCTFHHRVTSCCLHFTAGMSERYKECSFFISYHLGWHACIKMFHVILFISSLIYIRNMIEEKMLIKREKNHDTVFFRVLNFCFMIHLNISNVYTEKHSAY